MTEKKKERQLNDFNDLSKEVYLVEESKIILGDKLVDDKFLVIDTIDTNKDTLKTELTPRNNSMQAMTVAEIKDEFKSYHDYQLKAVEGYPYSVIKKDLTIVYAGTSGLKDWTTDVIEIGLNIKQENGAFDSALDYAKEIEAKYPKEEGFSIETSGHSLGGAQAIFVAVLLGYNAITYGAAGSGLTDEQINNYHGQVVNIYDTSDMVTSSLLTGGKGSIPFYSFGIDNADWKTFGHSLEQFKTDSAGNYIDKYENVAIYSDGHGGIALEQTLLAQQILENKSKIRKLKAAYGYKPIDLAEINRLEKENEWLQEQIKQFVVLNDLRATFIASGGGLTSSERIYLEDSQALSVLKLASSKFDLAMEESIDIYKKGISELLTDWEEGMRLIQQQTPDLSYAEMREAMDSVLCNKHTMVDSDAQYFQDKISKANRIKEEFAQLTREISHKIHQLVQHDRGLASQIKGALT